VANIGENIRRRREALGLTQEELAVRLGYKSKSSINKIEMGINDLPQKKIVKFAQALNTTPGLLMGWISEDINKKNDAMVGVVSKMRSDPDFLKAATELAELSAEDFASIARLISSLRNK
jgi:repressor LexA